MAASPAFAAVPRAAVLQVTAANTNRDGTGTIVSVVSPGASGTKIEEVIVQAVGTTTAGVVRLYLSPDAGTTWRLLDEFLVTAITPSSTISPFRASRKYANLFVPASTYRIGASTHNAETFNVICLGGDF